MQSTHEFQQLAQSLAGAVPLRASHDDDVTPRAPSAGPGPSQSAQSGAQSQ